MKCSFGISNFLEISSLSHSIVFHHWGRLSYLSLLLFGTLHSNACIFPFLLCLSLLFFSHLFVRPHQTTILPFFFLGMVLITITHTHTHTHTHMYIWISQVAQVVKNLPMHVDAKRHQFDPWVGKIPWRRKWQPTPVFLPRKSHGQRSLAGYSPWGHKELGTT